MKKKPIYVTQMYYGAYDGREKEIIYVGTDYELAKQKAKEFHFPDPHSNFGYIQHWKDGKEIKEELVRE